MHHKNIQLNFYDKICFTDHVGFISYFVRFFLLYKSTVKSEKCTILHMTSHLLLSFCESFNQTEEFLTVLSPSFDKQRLKNESKTLTSVDFLEHRSSISFVCTQENLRWRPKNYTGLKMKELIFFSSCSTPTPPYSPDFGPMDFVSFFSSKVETA